jgi:hypothetical protein
MVEMSQFLSFGLMCWMCGQRRAIRGHINPPNTDTCFTYLSYLWLLIYWPSYFFQKCRTFVVTSLEHWSENCFSPCFFGNLSDSFVLRVIETRQHRRCSRAGSIKVGIFVTCSCRNRWLYDRTDGRFVSYFSRATCPFLRLESQLTPWNRFLSEKLLGHQLVRKFATFLVPERSLPCWHEPAICPNPEPDQSLLFL